MTRHPAPSAAAAELREKHLGSICGGDPSTDPLPGHLRRPRTAEDRGQRIGIFFTGSSACYILGSLKGKNKLQAIFFQALQPYVRTAYLTMG